MSLKIRSKEKSKWDLISLGEVMLRLDPGEKRIWTTRSFEVYEGGGEYNVARGLKRCFGMDTAVATVFADNPVGRLIQDLIYQGGVDQSLVKWVPYDGVGRSVRNGLNFTDRGFGAETWGDRLGGDFRNFGGAMVPHRWNLLCIVEYHSGCSHGGDAGSTEARGSGFL
jgi:hypothetical protein